MRNEQIRRLLEIAEQALHQAQAVFAETTTKQEAAEETHKLTDEQRWARLLSHFAIATNHTLTPAQVSHAATASGYGDPRGVGALYQAHTGWLESRGPKARALTVAGLKWFETEGQKYLGDYEPTNV